MAVKERERQLRVVAEILLVHIPATLPADQALVRDLLAVVGTALRAIHEDAEQSARAWDKRAYDIKSDKLRREWGWALGASNYALGLALRKQPPDVNALRKLRQLIRPELTKSQRRQIKDPTRFRGAARAVRQQEASRSHPVREY